MLPKTQEILLETQGNLLKTQGTGAFEHNQAPKNRTKKPGILQCISSILGGLELPKQNKTNTTFLLPMPYIDIVQMS